MQTDNNSSISGFVERILFTNQQNGYLVCRVVSYNSHVDPVIVCGILPTVQEGVDITVTGSWSKHPKFGLQLLASCYTVLPPTHTKAIEKYLASGLIKGIGPAYAKKLVDYFGSSVLTIIDQEPAKLSMVSGIGPKRIEQITVAWIEQKEIAQIILFLQKYDISTTYAVKIYKAYKHNAIDFIIQNPYRLAEDIWGIGFACADSIAQKLGIALDSQKRFRAGFLHVISAFLQKGNVYIPLEQARQETALLLNLDRQLYTPSMKIVLHQLYNENKIALFSCNDEHFITLLSHDAAEKVVALRLSEILKTPSTLSLSIDGIYQKLRLENRLHELQQQAIIAALQKKIIVVTGGPGTGKTTLLKELLSILKQHSLAVLLAAPTGRAAKRMSQSTGCYAQTIHRLLEFDPSVMQFTKNKGNPLKADFIIIDEASMLDVFLAHAVLKAVPDTTHIVFVGDSNQLPSVGPGNVLADIIESKKIFCMELTHIFRQAQNSLIVVNAHRINQGDFFLTHQDNAASDFFFIKEESVENIPNHLVQLFEKRLYAMKINPSQTTVLVPMNRGSVGTASLNHALQKVINKAHLNGPSITFGATTFYIHDKVMQIKNNYDKLVFNGDVGIITECDLVEKTITVLFDTQKVVYEAKELEELTLAYVMSIHKSQGSEYDAVIIPLCMQHYTLLERRLLYTAITRAKKTCILIGQPQAFWTAIKNNRSINRITFLKNRLESID